MEACLLAWEIKLITHSSDNVHWARAIVLKKLCIVSSFFKFYTEDQLMLCWCHSIAAKKKSIIACLLLGRQEPIQNRSGQHSFTLTYKHGVEGTPNIYFEGPCRQYGSCKIMKWCCVLFCKI